MEIEQSSLYREVLTIISGTSKPVHYQWDIEIHVDKDTYRPLKLLSIDFIQDFENNFADEIMLDVAILGGVFAKRIYPFQDKIDITLFRRPLQERADVTDTEATVQSERYTATLIDTGNPLLAAGEFNVASEEILNRTNIFNVQFQLVNKSLEQLRMISIGGIYRNTTVEDVIKGVLTTESKKVEVEGGRLPKGVDMIPASNTVKRDHVVIPQGIKLVDLPAYIHGKCGGVYNAGLGYYLQDDFWYLYPCYDTTRFNTATKTLTVINVPANKFPQIERTYRQDGTNLVVIATGEISFSDDRNAVQLNEGNGVRFASADKFMEGFAITKGNKAVLDRGVNNSEFVATKRENGNNNVQVSATPIHSNAMLEYSKLARRQGSVLSFVWENSLPNLVYPGMMVKILYLEDGEIKELFGVSLKAHHYVQTHGQGMTDTRYVCRTMLAVFVKPPEK